MLLSRKKLQKIRYSKRQSRKRYKKKKGGKRKKRRNKSFRKRRKALNLRRKTLKYKHKGGAGEKIVTVFPSSFVGGSITGIRLAIVTNPFETTTEFINGILYNGQATDAAKQMYKEFQDIILGTREQDLNKIKPTGEFKLSTALTMAEFCQLRHDVLRVQIANPRTIKTVRAVIRPYVDVDDSVRPWDVDIDEGDQPAAGSKQESSQLRETKQHQDDEEVNCGKFNKAEGKYIPLGKRGSKNKKLKQVKACNKAPNCMAVKGKTAKRPHGHEHSNKGRFSCKRYTEPPTQETRPAEPTIASALDIENQTDSDPLLEPAITPRPGPPTPDFTALDDLVFPPRNTGAAAEGDDTSDEDDEHPISRPGEIEMAKNPGCAIANEFKTDSGEWREGFPDSVPCPANRDSLDANLRANGNYGALRNQRCESKAIELRQSLQDRCSSKYGDDGNLIQEETPVPESSGASKSPERRRARFIECENDENCPENRPICRDNICISETIFDDIDAQAASATGDVGANDGETDIPEEEAGYFAIYVVRDSPGDRIAISDGSPDAPKFKGFVRRLRKNTEGDIFKDFTWTNLGILTPRDQQTHETTISMNVEDMGFTRAQNIQELERISGEITNPRYVQSRTRNMLKNSGLRTCKVFAGAGDAGGARAVQGNLGGLPNNADGLPIPPNGQDARCVIFEMPIAQIDTRGDDPNDYSLTDEGVANLQNTKTLIENAMLSVPPAAAPAPASTDDGDNTDALVPVTTTQDVSDVGNDDENTDALVPVTTPQDDGDRDEDGDIPEPTEAPPQRPIPSMDWEIVPPDIVRAPAGVQDPITIEPITPGEVCYVSADGRYYYTMHTMNNILRNSTRLEEGQWVSGFLRDGNSIQATCPMTRVAISQDAINYIRPPEGRAPDSLSQGGMFQDVNLIQDNTTTIEEFLAIQGDESELTANEADYLFRWVRGNWNRYVGLSPNYRIGLLEGQNPHYYSGFVPSPPNEWEDVYFRPNTPVDSEVARAASGPREGKDSEEGNSSNETGGTGATTNQPGDVVPVAPQVEGDGTENTARVVQPGVPNMPEAPTTDLPQSQVTGENQGESLIMARNLPIAPNNPMVPRGSRDGGNESGNRRGTTPSGQPEAGRQPSSNQPPVDGTGSGSGAAAVAGSDGTGSGSGATAAAGSSGTGSGSGAPTLPPRPAGQQPGGPNPGGRPNPGGEGAPNPVAWPVPPTLPHFIVKGQMWPGDYQPQIRMWVDDGTNFSSWLRHLGQPIPIAAQPPQGPGGGGDGGRRNNDGDGGGPGGGGDGGGNNTVPSGDAAAVGASSASSASSSNLSTTTNNSAGNENSSTQPPSSGANVPESSSTEQRPVQGPELPPTTLNIENEGEYPQTEEIPRPPSSMVDVPQPDNNLTPSAPLLDDSPGPEQQIVNNPENPIPQPESTDSTTQLTVSARELNSQLTTIANDMNSTLNNTLMPQLQEAFNRGIAREQMGRIFVLMTYLREIRMMVNEQIATTLRLTEGENDGSEELTNISNMIQNLPERVQEIVNEILRVLNQPEESEPEITELQGDENALEDSAPANSPPSGRVQGMVDAIDADPVSGYPAAQQIAEQAQQQDEPLTSVPVALVTREQ